MEVPRLRDEAGKPRQPNSPKSRLIQSADIDPVKIVGVEKSGRYEKEDFARHLPRRASFGRAEPGI